MSLLIEELNGFNVKFKLKKPVEGFRYPVFLDEENRVFYYVIEKPTYIMKDKVEYEFLAGYDEPEDGVEYVAIAKDMMNKFIQSTEADNLLVLLKGPTLNYVKGHVFNLKRWKEGTEQSDNIYMGDYVSNRNHNFKSHMFATSKMTYVKKED